MKRYLVLALLAGGACGDNARECGEGTIDDGGVCVADEPPEPVVCGQGTQLDPVTMDRCVPDPSVCGPGLVLVNGVCADPTAGLTVDLEEGPEPNGFEPDATPAGTLAIAVGEPAKVIHGCITPTAVADLDVYRITVPAPTLLDLEVDGVQGLAGAFHIALPPPTVLGTWRRLGLAFGGDVSKRELYLPTAGTYLLAFADARTLFPLLDAPGTPPEELPVAGNADGTSCYYATLSPLDRAPVPLDAATDVTSTIDHEVKLFEVTGLTAGTHVFVETIDSAFAEPAMVVLLDDAVNLGDARGTVPVEIAPGQRVRVAADFTYNFGVGPAPFQLAIDP